MSLGNCPKLALSLNGIMVATDSGSATSQAALGVKAIADMAQKIAGIKQYANQASNCFSQIAEQAASLFSQAAEISGQGDVFLKQAGETLTQNGEATGAEIGDVTEDDNAQGNNCTETAGNNAGNNTSNNAGNATGDNGSNTSSTPVATTNSGVTTSPSTANTANNGSNGAISTPQAQNQNNNTAGTLTTQTPDAQNSEQAGAYFDRRQAALAKETQEDNQLKAEKGDENAKAKVKEETGIEQTETKDKNTKEKSIGKNQKNPQENDIDDQIQKLQNENKSKNDKKEQFKPLVEQDAGQFAQIKKQIKALDDNMKQNQTGFNNVKKESKEKMEKGNAKSVQQAALSSSATAMATAAQGQNTAAAPLFSNPYTMAAAATMASSAFATNQGASAVDQQANQAGQEAAQNFQTAVANMKQGLSQYATPQSGLANQKMNLAKNLLTLNNARKEQIQSVQDDNQTIAKNDNQIKQLINTKKSFGLQTTKVNA